MSVNNTLKKHADKLRFGLVGILNTTIDFVILFSLVAMGLPTIVSNFISTSIALTFSFFANKTFTFKDKSRNDHKRFAYFLVITLSGLWVIQPVIIEIVRLLAHPLIDSSGLVLLIGKLLATCVTLVWNYLLYRKFVFTDRS